MLCASFRPFAHVLILAHAAHGYDGSDVCPPHTLPVKRLEAVFAVAVPAGGAHPLHRVGGAHRALYLRPAGGRKQGRKGADLVSVHSFRLSVFICVFSGVLAMCGGNCRSGCMKSTTRRADNRPVGVLTSQADMHADTHTFITWVHFDTRRLKSAPASFSPSAPSWTWQPSSRARRRRLQTPWACSTW